MRAGAVGHHSIRVGPRLRRARSAAARGRVHGQEIVAVHAQRGNAAAHATTGEGGALAPAMAWNVEMAHWLLTTFRITGARYTWAKVSAVWKSASAVAPSPIQPEAMRVSPLMAEAMPQPTAWMNCVAGYPRC